jgi:hypothetical protein
MTTTTMDPQDEAILKISDQRQKMAVAVHSYAKELNLAIRHPTDEVIGMLAGLLHLCDQNGINFNDAIGKARIKFLIDKREL